VRHEEVQFRADDYNLRFSQARKMAEAECVALNQLINVAVAEKLSALRIEDYFSERAARADITKALKIPQRAGVGKAPMKGDELLPTKRRKARSGTAV